MNSLNRLPYGFEIYMDDCVTGWVISTLGGVATLRGLAIALEAAGVITLPAALPTALIAALAGTGALGLEVINRLGGNEGIYVSVKSYPPPLIIWPQ